jgi:hypothetical protein
MRGSALVFFDNIGTFFNVINGFNRVCMVDWTKSHGATLDFIGTAATFSFAGLSFNLNKWQKNCIIKFNILILLFYMIYYLPKNNHLGGAACQSFSKLNKVTKPLPVILD